MAAPAAQTGPVAWKSMTAALAIKPSRSLDCIVSSIAIGSQPELLRRTNERAVSYQPAECLLQKSSLHEFRDFLNAGDKLPAKLEKFGTLSLRAALGQADDLPV